MNRKSIALVIAASLAAIGGTAVAQSQSGSARVHEDARELADAKITITQAIEAAQAHHAGSKAVEAALERDAGRTLFEVSVVTPDSKVHEVEVDAADGKVLESREDKDD